jgi:hypothetical protein
MSYYFLSLLAYLSLTNDGYSFAPAGHLENVQPGN